ncbi:hypothetical protein [Wolbachia endosymbiont (group A) of Clivina fossor]|uniref:hypothetical protein n=1 Tax=Wolbachia endosymbiont (group A) of Clivina fossor TaxID=3066133 RepID=UPI0031333F06
MGRQIEYTINSLKPPVIGGKHSFSFVSLLLRIGITTIKTQVGTDLISGIKAKTDNMPDNLVTELGKLAKSSELAPLVAPLAKTADVTAIKTKIDKMPADLEADVNTIKAKTDNMPDNLVTELSTLAKSAELGPLAKTADVDVIKAKTDKMPADLKTELTTITTETNKIADIKTNVGDIKAKTDKITDTLGADVTTIKTQVGTDLISGIKAKTDKMPADLNAELMKLTTIGNAINGSDSVTEAAKTVLENSFKQAIEKAAESDWLEKLVADIVSQPKFDMPESNDAALNWTW